MWKKELRKYDFDETTFNKLLYIYSDKIVKVDNFNEYRYGYKNTPYQGKLNTVIYDGKEYLVILEYLANGIVTNNGEIEDDTIPFENTWRQCIIRLKREQETKCKAEVNGWYAYNYMIKLLKKNYSANEIEERFSMFEAEYNENKIQEHFFLADRYQLLTFDNCYKYDINSAHASALIDIFPKSTQDITWLYEHRKDNPEYKDFLNFFVGYFCRVNHRKTYNWIVQRTTSILRDAVKRTNGTIIYANTDGFIVHNPNSTLENSSLIGEFKEEYKGEVRFYKDKNWFVYEIDAEKDHHKGTLIKSVRPLVNLKERKIVHYDKVLPTGKHNFIVQNITEEII